MFSFHAIHQNKMDHVIQVVRSLKFREKLTESNDRINAMLRQTFSTFTWTFKKKKKQPTYNSHLLTWKRDLMFINPHFTILLFFCS